MTTPRYELNTPATGAAGQLRAIFIVVPARNEAELIGRCLRSICDATIHARNAWGGEGPEIFCLVVADSCTDNTAALVRAAGMPVIEVQRSNVGAARAAGVECLFAELRASTGLPLDPATVWLANTDADSVVPVNWLTTQVSYAAEHYELMIGTVRPDFADLSHEQIFAWQSLHTAGYPNGHVHGANLGVRGNAYLAAGGFGPLEEHEDVTLAQRLEALGASIVASDLCEVMTSGRGKGRTPGGYAKYLSEELIARSLATVRSN